MSKKGSILRGKKWHGMDINPTPSQAEDIKNYLDSLPKDKEKETKEKDNSKTKSGDE